MVAKGQDIELTIEDFAFEGKSLSRLDGFVIFVYGAVPGDTVLAKILRVKKSFAEARVIQIMAQSPLRTTPKCKYFGTCGGCKWQNLNYQSQLEFKRQNVIDALERIGNFREIGVNPTLGSEDIYFYRNKMEFSFGNERWLTQEELKAKDEKRKTNVERKEVEDGSHLQPPLDFALGLHVPERFDKVLDIDECWLQSELSNQILNTVREFGKSKNLSIHSTKPEAYPPLAEKTHTGYLRNLVIREGKNNETLEVMVNLVTSEDKPEIMGDLCNTLIKRLPQITTVVNNITTRKSQVAVGDYERVYYGDGVITDRVGDFRFRISANSFFQTNTKQAEKLYATARDLAQLQPTDVVYDLYSGAGTIAIYISKSVKKVIGIEMVEIAITDARRNAGLNGVVNCFFLEGDLKDKLTKDTRWVTEHGKPDVVMVDPPRSGIHPKVVREILQLAPSRIVYVSCNPTTQARDLKTLCEGKYRLDVVQPVDMFPHTYHIENVVRLTLR